MTILKKRVVVNVRKGPGTEKSNRTSVLLPSRYAVTTGVFCGGGTGNYNFKSDVRLLTTITKKMSLLRTAKHSKVHKARLLVLQ